MTEPAESLRRLMDEARAVGYEARRLVAKSRAGDEEAVLVSVGFIRRVALLSFKKYRHQALAPKTLDEEPSKRSAKSSNARGAMRRYFYCLDLGDEEGAAIERRRLERLLGYKKWAALAREET